MTGRNKISFCETKLIRRISLFIASHAFSIPSCFTILASAPRSFTTGIVDYSPGLVRTRTRTCVAVWCCCSHVRLSPCLLSRLSQSTDRSGGAGLSSAAPSCRSYTVHTVHFSCKTGLQLKGTSINIDPHPQIKNIPQNAFKT